MNSQRTAPVYLNLFRIRLPVGAVTSIAHRISGVLMFLSIPLFVYLLELSLRDADGFAAAAGLLRLDLVRFGSVLIVWSLLHHLFTGIRFLFMDVEQGVELKTARFTAWLVSSLALAGTLGYAGWLL